MTKELIISGEYLVNETVSCQKLIIEEDAVLTAPEGKFVTLIHEGIGRQPLPGTYNGDITLAVADTYHMLPHGLMRPFNRSEDFHCALVIEDNKVMENKAVKELIHDGTITDTEAKDFTLQSDEDNFNGIVITGDSHYTISNAEINLEGHGFNDFLGAGAGIQAIDNAKVQINDSNITMAGVTRCAIHCGGDAVIEVNDCNIVNQSPDDPEWMGDFSWGIGVTGTNRLVQLADNGTVYYNRCYLKTNGWGVFSIDGCDDVARVYVTDCVVDLSGPRANGYGTFCIGDRNTVVIDGSDFHVNGYAMIVRGMIDGAAKAQIINGSNITGNRFGVICIGDCSTPVTLADSSFNTRMSTLVVKGSSTDFEITNCDIKAGNGVILQLQDNDECGMDYDASKVPDRADVYEEGRDLAAISGDDVTLTLVDNEIEGNFFNSTTNLHMENEGRKGGMGNPKTFGGLFAPPEGGPNPLEAPPAGAMENPDAPAARDEINYEKKLRGPKNLGITLVNTTLSGQISSADAKYREGVEWIDEYNRQELSNITQEAAPTINNGVVVNVDTDSTWFVQGTNYITKLIVGEHALILAPAGKKLTMTIDGQPAVLEQGKTYEGKIVLSVA